jgi:hypothetical protein
LPLIESFEIYGSRVATPPYASIAADVESRPCEGGGIGGRRERQHGQAGEAKTQSSTLVHGCSPAKTSLLKQILSTISANQLSPLYNSRDSFSAEFMLCASHSVGRKRPGLYVGDETPERGSVC